MRRIAAALLALGLAVPAYAAHRTTIGVGLREYRLALYRDKVRPGSVKFNLTNFGEDPHDFVIRARSGRIVARSGEVAAGARRALLVKFPHAGRYVVFCSLADHEQRGMRAVLTVSRSARG